MILKEITGTQSKWFNENFALTKKEQPEMIDYAELKSQILGLSDIRLDDYFGDGYSFEDLFYLSLTASPQSNRNTKRMTVQLIYLFNQSVSNEFFELSNNLNIVLQSTNNPVLRYVHECADESIKELISKIDGISVS